MAAGLGFKTFTTGEVLTAADTNGYLMQGVLVFASSAARAAAITSPQEGQYSYLKDTNSTEYYDGAAWIAAPIGDITGVTAGTGISGGGTSGTVTITNDMATTITAAGDIVVGTGSGTYDNLPIGTTAQVLTADTTVSPYKVKWATPAASSSGMTFISRTSFSNVASQAIDSVFSSSYYSYVAIIEKIYAATDTDNLMLQLRYGATTQAANYYGGAITTNRSNTTTTNTPSNNASELTFSLDAGNSTQPSGAIQINFNSVGNTSEVASLSGFGLISISYGLTSFAAKQVVAETYTGFLLKSGSSNITGVVSVYGLAKA